MLSMKRKNFMHEKKEEEVEKVITHTGGKGKERKRHVLFIQNFNLHRKIYLTQELYFLPIPSSTRQCKVVSHGSPDGDGKIT